MAKENSSDRKQQIIMAAMKIISEQGIQKLTMKQIAGHVGISDAALYRHFENKKAILMAMIDEIGKNLTGFIAQRVASFDDPVEKLQNLLRLHLKFVEQNKGIPRILFSEEIHINEPDLKKRTATMIKNYLDMIQGILYRAVQEGKVRTDLNIEAAATAFLGLIQGSIILWSLDEYSHSIADRHESLWSVYTGSLK